MGRDGPSYDLYGGLPERATSHLGDRRERSTMYLVSVASSVRSVCFCVVGGCGGGVWHIRFQTLARCIKGYWNVIGVWGGGMGGAGEWEGIIAPPTRLFSHGGPDRYSEYHSP